MAKRFGVGKSTLRFAPAVGASDSIRLLGRDQSCASASVRRRLPQHDKRQRAGRLIGNTPPHTRAPVGLPFFASTNSHQLICSVLSAIHPGTKSFTVCQLALTACPPVLDPL